MPTDDMTLEKALALVREIGESLGGEQARACAVVCRVAERTGKRTTGRMEAVGGMATGAQHFAKATADLQDVRAKVDAISEDISLGLAEVARSSRTIREAEVETSDTDPRVER